MKKWIAGIVVLIVLFFALTYILIPSTLVVSNMVYCKASLPGTSRSVMSESEWKKWWMNKEAASANNFEYKEDKYSLTDTYINSVVINIKHGSENFKTEMRVLVYSQDSIKINWECAINTSLNPFKRIGEYREAAALKTNTKDILNHIKYFVESTEKMYGIPITQSSIEHVFLLTTKTVFDHYPSTTETYNSINFLKHFISNHDLKQTYYPMINVTKEDTNAYRLMVGLPVDKGTNFTGNIQSVRMVQGNFMVTQVKGADKTINNALDQLQLYFQDYGKTAMAIPFQYLVTDRMNEPDTTKWITTIYAPVN